MRVYVCVCVTHTPWNIIRPYGEWNLVKFATTWADTEGIVLSEVSQTEGGEMLNDLLHVNHKHPQSPTKLADKENCQGVGFGARNG